MNRKLFAEAIFKFMLGVVLVGALLFLPAGTVHYLQGWLLMGVLFVPMFFAGLVMMKKSPELLRRRLDAKEKAGEQQQIIRLSALLFLCAFILSGLSVRFSWAQFPLPVSYAGAGIFLLGYVLYAFVLRQNAYLSRTIRVEDGQRVIDTGLYGVVRHPMYLATLLLFLSMPVILGSPIAFVLMLFYIPLIAQRIRHEEKPLAKELPGYTAYMHQVRFRVIPFIW